MMRVAILVWIIAGTVLAGCFITVVLMMPQLQLDIMTYIPIAAMLGAVVAIIPSWLIAKSILSKIKS